MTEKKQKTVEDLAVPADEAGLRNDGPATLSGSRYRDLRRLVGMWTKMDPEGMDIDTARRCFAHARAILVEIMAASDWVPWYKKPAMVTGVLTTVGALAGVAAVVWRHW